MKRTVEIELFGNTYLLCCPLGAVEELEEKYGNIQTFADKMSERKAGPVIDALGLFLKYGAKRAEQLEGDGIGYPGKEQLYCDLNLSDFPYIIEKVSETITLSFENTIKGTAKGKKKAAE